MVENYGFEATKLRFVQIRQIRAENRPKSKGEIWKRTDYFVPFLYKTEINSLARVTKIKDMVKNGAYNYITSLYLTCVYK